MVVVNVCSRIHGCCSRLDKRFQTSGINSDATCGHVSIYTRGIYLEKLLHCCSSTIVLVVYDGAACSNVCISSHGRDLRNGLLVKRNFVFDRVKFDELHVRGAAASASEL